MARKALSKKIRFEVFKRDSFTCQYCGAQAPDVILHADHIQPVAGGGTNDLLNLVTSCAQCNLGKSDRLLNDDAVLKKRHIQASVLNDRLQQLKMMADWNESLLIIDLEMEDIVKKKINRYLNSAKKEISDWFFNESIRPLIKKYSLEVVLLAIDGAATTYLKDTENKDDRNRFLEMITKVAYWKNQEAKNPRISELRKIAYTAKKHWWTCNPQELTQELLSFHQKNGIPIDELGRLAFSNKGIMKFREAVNSWLVKNG